MFLGRPTMVLVFRDLIGSQTAVILSCCDTGDKSANGLSLCQHLCSGVVMSESDQQPGRNVRFPFHRIEPTFFSGLLDDPILLIRTRPDGRHLMLDCGQIHHLAKRTLTHLDTIFISHAHMDHWMGIDSVIRQLIAAGKTVDIYGGPGIADKFEYKLKGYEWNLAEDYWSNFRVHEVQQDRITCDLFAGVDSFRREAAPDIERTDQVIFKNNYLEVLAESCDHRVESLIFRINERPAYIIDKGRLAELNLLPGPWLGTLKRCFLRDEKFPEQLKVYQRQGGCRREILINDVPHLVQRLVQKQKTVSIGYISDVGFNAANQAKIIKLMKGVDLLICECTFLREAKERARASWHLCTDDINDLLAELQPQFFLPMHLSRSYSRRSSELYRELVLPIGTTVLKLPLHLTPRPLLANELAWQGHIQG